MKICLVCRRINQTGGVGRYVYELCKYLTAHSHDVHIYTNGYDAPPLKGLTIHHVPMIQARFLEKLKYHALAKTFQVWSFAFLSRMLINSKTYDVVHVQGDSLAAADVRTAHSCHLAWLRSSHKKAAGKLKKLMKSTFNPLHFIVTLIEGYNFNNCTRTISVSRQVADEIHDNYGVTYEKLKIIPNGVDIERFTPSNRNKYLKEIRDKYSVSYNDILLVFVGHEFERKGLAAVMDAMKELSNRSITLFVIGNDKDISFKDRANELGLSSRIKFISYTAEVEKYYAAADIFVLPASYEPFGLVVTEAMASGLPAVISSTAGAAELIEHGKNGLLISSNNAAHELAGHIRQLIENSEFRRTISAEARKTSEQFSWLHMGRNTEMLYQEVASVK